MRPSTESAHPQDIVVDDGITWMFWKQTCDGVVDWVYIPQVTPGQAAHEVPPEDLLALLPRPSAHTVPSPEFGQPGAIVQFPFWFWVDPKQWSTPIDLPVSFPTFTLTLRATPARLVFTPGDGSAAVTCAGPGLAFTDAVSVKNTPDPCSYRYHTTPSSQGKASYASSLAIGWDVTWSATDGSSGALDPLTTTTDLQTPVVEVQVLNS
jgi:hypothetical protein